MAEHNPGWCYKICDEEVTSRKWAIIPENFKYDTSRSTSYVIQGKQNIKINVAYIEEDVRYVHSSTAVLLNSIYPNLIQSVSDKNLQTLMLNEHINKIPGDLDSLSNVYRYMWTSGKNRKCVCPYVHNMEIDIYVALLAKHGVPWYKKYSEYLAHPDTMVTFYSMEKPDHAHILSKHSSNELDFLLCYVFYCSVKYNQNDSAICEIWESRKQLIKNMGDGNTDIEGVSWEICRTTRKLFLSCPKLQRTVILFFLELAKHNNIYKHFMSLLEYLDMEKIIIIKKFINAPKKTEAHIQPEVISEMMLLKKLEDEEPMLFPFYKILHPLSEINDSFYNLYFAAAYHKNESFGGVEKYYRMVKVELLCKNGDAQKKFISDQLGIDVDNYEKRT